MKNIIRFFIVFLVITFAVSILMNLFDIEFGIVNYWDLRGVFFLIFVAIFPRLTLLFSSVPFGGLFWWLGWFFAPRLLVAILATISYWNTNKILVIVSWLIAWGGESSEKIVVHKKAKKSFRGDTIEAEYTVVEKG